MNNPETNPTETAINFHQTLLDRIVTSAHDLDEHELVFNMMVDARDVDKAQEALNIMIENDPTTVWPRHYLSLYYSGVSTALNQASELALTDLADRIPSMPFYDNSDAYDRLAIERQQVAVACARQHNWDDAIGIIDLLPNIRSGTDYEELSKQRFIREMQLVALTQDDTDTLKRLLDLEDATDHMPYDYFNQYSALRARIGDDEAAAKLRQDLSEAIDKHFADPMSPPRQVIKEAAALLLAGLENNWDDILDFVFADYKEHRQQYMADSSAQNSVISDRPLLALQNSLIPEIWERIAYTGVSRGTAKAKIQELLDKYDLRDKYDFQLDSHLDIGYDKYCRAAGKQVPSDNRRPTPKRDLQSTLGQAESTLKGRLDLRQYTDYVKELTTEELTESTDLHARLAGYLYRIGGGEVELIDDALTDSTNLILQPNQFSYLLQLLRASL